MNSWPKSRRLRRWQQEAYAAYRDRGDRRSFGIVACPGAGKTTALLRFVSHDVEVGAAQQAVVVVPTDHLRRQWANAAAQVGVQLDCFFRNDGTFTRGFDGVVVTYQQVARAPYLFRRLCSVRRTVVTLDEIHHAGGELTWARALMHAFGGAALRNWGTGTLFREDDEPIPFVRYADTDDGYGRESVPDYEYGYAQALVDRVCRPIVFPVVDGRMQWVTNYTTHETDKGQTIERSFGAPLPKGQAAERLRTALTVMTPGGWLATVLGEAHQRLLEVRRTHPQAGGLLITSDRQHAEAIAKLLASVTGVRPLVAVSADPKASKKIQQFTESTAPWLVAVRMVSEGVDIPRLRVGVFATNVGTELYFRQAVGRFVRMVRGLSGRQTAYLYIPRDPGLVEFATALEAERQHALPVDEEAALSQEGDDPQAGLFDELLAKSGTTDSQYSALDAVAELGGTIASPTAAALDASADAPLLPMSLAERRELLRQEVSSLVVKLAARLGERPATIHREWIRGGGSPQNEAEVEELEQKLAWCRRRMANRSARGRRPTLR